MKNLVAVFILGISIFSMSSCKKCSTCTTRLTSSTGSDSTITSEFCGKGKVYKDELDTYNKNNWVCVDK